jgi:hypothetical protein
LASHCQKAESKTTKDKKEIEIRIFFIRKVEGMIIIWSIVSNISDTL